MSQSDFIFDEDDLQENKPDCLKLLAFTAVLDPTGNSLLHNFVLKNSYPNVNAPANYITAVLRCMSSNLPVNKHNKEGFTALHLAIQKNNITMIEKLVSCILNLDLDVPSYNSKYKGTPLHLAVMFGQLEVVKILLSGGADVNRICDHANETPLHFAAKTNFPDIVKELLSAGASANARNTKGRIPLHIAAGRGNLSVVKILIKKCDVNALDHNLETALYCASVHGHAEIVQELLSNMAYVLICNAWTETPLHSAATHGQLEIVKILLRANANVNAVTCLNETPLHYAAAGNHYQILRELLLKGALYDVISAFGKTPIDIALENCKPTENSINILKLFKQYLQST